MNYGELLMQRLTQLSERSHTYARQFWQVPFAYIAASGVVLAQLTAKPDGFAPALFIIGGVGIFVIWHLCSIYKAAHRCFESMQQVEEQLSFILPQGATRWTPSQLIALLVLTCVWTAGCLVAALYLVCWSSGG